MVAGTRAIMMDRLQFTHDYESPGTWWEQTPKPKTQSDHLVRYLNYGFQLMHHAQRNHITRSFLLQSWYILYIRESCYVQYTEPRSLLRQ